MQYDNQEHSTWGYNGAKVKGLGEGQKDLENEDLKAK